MAGAGLVKGNGFNNSRRVPPAPSSHVFSDVRRFG